MKDTTT